MDETKAEKSRFTCKFWLSVEILAFIAFSTYTAQKLYRGAKFSEGDIIFTACIVIVSVLTICLTILCYILYRRRLDRHRCIDVSPLMKRISEDTGSVCAICLNPRESYRTPVVSLSCKHKYHEKCICQCLQHQEKMKCPLCRSQPTEFPAPYRLLALTKTSISEELTRLQKA